MIKTSILLLIAFLALFAFGKELQLSSFQEIDLESIAVSSDLHRRPSASHAPVTLSFSTKDNRSFSFDLKPDTSIMKKGSKMTVYGDHNEITSEGLTPVIHSLVGVENENVRITFLNEAKTLFRGFYVDSDNTMHIFSPRGSRMITFQPKDIAGVSEPIACGVTAPGSAGTLSSVTGAHVRSLLETMAAPLPLPVDGCPTEKKKIFVSVVVEHRYVARMNTLGVDLLAYIQSEFQFFAPIYSRVVNVIPALGDLIVKTAPTSDPWNAPGTCPDIGSQLETFTESVQSLPSSDLWHLFMDCYTAGTIGMAWLDVICGDTHNAAVSSWTNSDLSAVVIAHELGHNFGSGHTSEGLMQPYLFPDMDDFDQQSQAEMCAHLSTRTCLKPFDCDDPICWPDSFSLSSSSETPSSSSSSSDDSEATCQDKADGNYCYAPCSTTYYSCVGGTLYGNRPTSPGTVCKDGQQILAATCDPGSESSSSSSETPSSSSSSSSSSEAPSSSSSSSESPEATCDGKADGNYCYAPCSDTYYTCLSGSLYGDRQAPPGTVCKDGTWTYPDNCDPGTESSSSDAPPSSSSSSSSSSSEAPEATCDGKVDGDYCYSPCSSTYYSCLSGFFYGDRQTPPGTVCKGGVMVLPDQCSA